MSEGNPPHSAGRVLSDEHLRVLEGMRRGKWAASRDDMIEATALGEVPLTSNQARIWFFMRAFPQSAEYTQPVSLHYSKALTLEQAGSAVNALVARHDALRLGFAERDGEVFQFLQGDLEADLREADLKGSSRQVVDLHAADLVGKFLREPFDIARSPLFRALLIQLPRQRSTLVLAVHHLIADGASMQILTRDLVDLLAQRSPGAPSPCCFLDFAAHEARRRNARDAEAALSYWCAKLSGDIPLLNLPTDRPRPDIPSRTGHTVPCAIGKGTSRRIAELASDSGTTMFMVLLAAYKTVLMRLTGQDDIVVGTPLFGRRNAELDATVGMFVNTVPLRTRFSPSQTFAQLLGEVRDTVIEAQEYGDLPFDQIVSAINLPRALNNSPLFQTVFGFGGVPSSPPQAEPRINAMPLDTGAAKWDLTLFLDSHDGQVSGQLEFSADLFDQATAERIVDMFTRICCQVADSPDQEIGRLHLLGSEERQHILEDLNPYIVPFDRYTTVTQPFEEQVLRSPDAVALETVDGSVMSYAELNRRANQLAHWLLDHQVTPRDAVAICMERSPELIVSIYAVAKVGAAYVPLDPELPHDRLAFMVQDTKPALILVHQDTSAHKFCSNVVEVYGDGRDPWCCYPAVNPICTAPAHRQLHYLYTSGTTGRPKAVAYPVNGALAEIFWLHRSYPSLGEGDTNIFLTSFGFDVSIWEIFWTLYFGGRLVIPASQDRRNPRRIAELVRQYGATTLFLIPGMLDAVLDEPAFASPGKLRWVFCGGAPVSAQLRDKFYERLPATILINCYGPTEAGAVTDLAIPRDKGNPLVPLGRPASNFRLYVLDGNLEPVPIGVPGEVFLGGKTGIALGYHDRRTMTAERFLPDPFGEPGQRMYRTGDLCRYRADGILEHLGRTDRQAKVRGMRIEPAEIERVISEHPDIERCHVMVSGDGGGTGHLPAFAVPKQGAKPTPADILTHATRFLPAHMMPTSLHLLDALPLTVNQKVDQAALGLLASERRTIEAMPQAPPETELQANILDIFREVVGTDQIGIDHNFFSIGGHSLLILRLVSRCGDRIGWHPSIADIFLAPTVRQLAQVKEDGDASRNACLVKMVDRPGQPIIVLIHPAGGSVLPFVHLAKALGEEFAVWGFQSPDLDCAGDWSIKWLAETYAAQIDRERDLAPVILIGWSMGGCIALEIGRLWKAKNVDPAAVMLLDTWVPPMTLEERQRARSASALHALDVLGREGLASSDLGLEAKTLDRMAETARRNVAAFAAYVPSIVDLPIDYLRAEREIDCAAEELSDALGREADRGWSAFVANALVHLVAGDHFDMVGKANAESLSAKIKSIVAEKFEVEEI